MKNIVPELIAICTVVLMGRECSDLQIFCAICLLVAVLFRSIWNSAIIIHGLGHTLAISFLDRNPRVNISDIFEARSIKTVLQSLIPGAPIFIPGLERDEYPYLAAGNAVPWQIRLKALGGIGCNVLAAGMVWQASEYSQSTPQMLVWFEQAFILANILIAFCSWTDLHALITGIADNFYCGNFGFICQRHKNDGNSLLSERMSNMYFQMGRETEIRGEQAGGGLVIAKDRSDRLVFVGEKIVNRKRDNLTNSLETAFNSVRRKAQNSGIAPLEMTTTGVWHYRFGTSGPPAVIETHWHEWMSARTEKVWDFIEGQWVCQEKNVNHRITHNGDFDAWTLYGKPVENEALGLWLERVLHTSNYAKGDSPKIAGMMDLLITKGIWYASVRLAYHLTVADSVEDLFDGQAPSREAPDSHAPNILQLSNWAKAFENTFMLYRRLLAAPNSPACNQYLCRLEHDILQVLAQDETVSQWSWSKRVNFVRTAVHAFLSNDANLATKTFMAGAMGSFGLVVVSTLDKERLVLSAKGQPISIGFNWQEGYMVYASEPAAVDAVLLNLPESYRLDLNQKEGEVALVSANDIVIYSLSKNKELNSAELKDRWISMENHPYLPHVKYPAHDTKDPIASDNQEIPAILEEIKLVWQNPSSLNCQTADYLMRLLCEKARNFEQQRQKMLRAGLSKLSKQLPTVDLLLVGVENSLWLGERFAEDLRNIFPWLNIRCISSNQVLQNLKYNLGGLQLGKESIVLGITQSGQTFPTIQAINAFDQLYRQGEICELFILTGELGSFLGSPVIKPKQSGRRECHKIFVNGSGRRTAEPATVAVAAAQQTFTELLLYLAKNLREAFPNSRPFGMTMTSESIAILEKMKNEFIDISLVQLMGTTPTGKQIDSSIREELIKSGRKWANHITETPTAWAIHALYVLITVGWAIPFGYTIPLAKTVFAGFLWLLPMSQDLLIYKLMSSVVTLVDIGIYIFGSWLWTLGLRYFQGRELLARIGKRSLVIGDVPWVHHLLKNYVSKLFALSYGIASLEVHGADPEDDLLHDFGHRVVRGTLLFLGVPDGRKSKRLKQQENAVIMAGKQADGVRNINVGPEVVVMGSNPEIAHKGFTNAIILESDDEHFHLRDDAVYFQSQNSKEQKALIEELRESRFSAFERLLASYIFFWALAKKVASFPVLNYEHWKSQSRTKIMTTAAPVAGMDAPTSVANNTQPKPSLPEFVILNSIKNWHNDQSDSGTKETKNN
ncbi:MAG: hypothetical protein QNJ72_05940 [Pleurocapsa sp. MO_226.B13]|nr:hypothetical protein [Pleurocapsa sp. MO_226.B13]